MVEVHGWLNLRYSDYHSEETEQHDFVYEFKKFIQKNYEWILTDGIGHLTMRNGFEYFTLNALHNHAGSPFYPLTIFAWAAENSTGSYGILYFRDDEDELYDNEFQVFVLKRGSIIRVKDSFLSPYNKEVEKEYDPNDPPKD